MKIRPRYLAAVWNRIIKIANGMLTKNTKPECERERAILLYIQDIYKEEENNNFTEGTKYSGGGPVC